MILVDVYIPSIDDSYDFILDEHTPISNVISELVGIIARKTKSKDPRDRGEFLLYRMDDEKMLREDQTLSDSGVTDGCRLLLI